MPPSGGMPPTSAAGHGPQKDVGSLWDKLGQVGDDLTVEEGAAAARRVALSMLGTLQRELGSLDRIGSWVKVLGMANLPFGIPVEVEAELELR